MINLLVAVLITYILYVMLEKTFKIKLKDIGVYVSIFILALLLTWITVTIPIKEFKPSCLVDKSIEKADILSMSQINNKDSFFLISNRSLLIKKNSVYKTVKIPTKNIQFKELLTGHPYYEQSIYSCNPFWVWTFTIPTILDKSDVIIYLPKNNIINSQYEEN